MNVSAVLVTRGNVDMAPVLDSLPPHWEKVVWDNSGRVTVYSTLVHDLGMEHLARMSNDCEDMGVYGRYAALRHAHHDLIYVQDDDCLVAAPHLIADRWCELTGEPGRQGLVANMPLRFVEAGYTDSCLVGFGACFHRDLWPIALGRWTEGLGVDRALAIAEGEREFFRRTCDVVLTTQVEREIVDVGYEDREFASDPDRMWKQPHHVGERKRMLELCREARDARP